MLVFSCVVDVVSNASISSASGASYARCHCFPHLTTTVRLFYSQRLSRSWNYQILCLAPKCVSRPRCMSARVCPSRSTLCLLLSYTHAYVCVYPSRSHAYVLTPTCVLQVPMKSCAYSRVTFKTCRSLLTPGTSSSHLSTQVQTS